MIDASVVTAVCLTAGGFDLVPDDLQAPILLRSETLAAIQGMQWREEISSDLAEIAVARLLEAPIRFVRRSEVLSEARRLALSLGWAKIYEMIDGRWGPQVSLSASSSNRRKAAAVGFQFPCIAFAPASP